MSDNHEMEYWVCPIRPPYPRLTEFGTGSLVGINSSDGFYMFKVIGVDMPPLNCGNALIIRGQVDNFAGHLLSVSARIWVRRKDGGWFFGINEDDIGRDDVIELLWCERQEATVH